MNADNTCKHYQRKCSLIAPCCKKEYQCRFCHDDNEEHTLDRKLVEEVVCLQCKNLQKVSKNCEECGILFGNYSCMTCRLFDDVDKKQFHCDQCGICRVGGSENFFHCDRCGMCLGIALKDTHRCLEGLSKRNCPVCLEDIHTSRKSTHVPKCGHLIHSKCFDGMLKHGQASCPICNESLIDMSSHWKVMDQVVAETPMPEIYRDYKVNILCRDCHEESKVLFHIVGLKCAKCSSYNTTRIGGDDPLPEDIFPTNVGDQADDGWETVSEGSHLNDDDDDDDDNDDENDIEIEEGTVVDGQVEDENTQTNVNNVIEEEGDENS